MKMPHLGERVSYDAHYNPALLFPISRQAKRDALGVTGVLPFVGFDLWNHYEVSWLNEKGKPVVALAEIVYDCNSPCIVESKSMKLYFNSFNNTVYKNKTVLESVIKKDLMACVGMPVTVRVMALCDAKEEILAPRMAGIYLDELDITCDTYEVFPAYLKTEKKRVEETLFSNLLKSNCLVTHQPDWASVQIHYQGNKIDHAGLLKYLISFRNHNEFHEQCIERIFMDIINRCQPSLLQVYGRYTRRGGLDINAYRGTCNMKPTDHHQRLIRQ